MKIAVCTTFPNDQFKICAAEMLASFKQHWPEDIKIYIQLDEQTEESFAELNNSIMDIMGEDRCFIAGKFEEEQKNFIEKYKDNKPESYLWDVVKFSHKIFALEKCADAIKDDIDYLIWLDADVITKQPVTYEWLKTVLPGDREVVSYLGREGFYSECGWVAYNLKPIKGKCAGYELLREMKDEYISGNFQQYDRGWTDCHVLDHCLKHKKALNLSSFYEKNVTDINVWNKSKLAETMTHRKGNRKNIAAENRGKPLHQQQATVVDSGSLKIKTRNCVDHGVIRANVSANLGQIRAWATLCKNDPDGEIVMCAAGPSLVDHIDEIKELQANGAKVVAVKHAIDALKTHGIKPWAVVLLDPREHVSSFIKNPDKDAIYFVASMCNPEVVKILNENRCVTIGYHAYVNAGETELMITADLPVSGGSATSTRSIGLFSDMLGIKKFHLFGIDLCHYQKPPMDEKSADGQPKYIELSIGTQSHKGKSVSRTFYTEGQFLAQKNEIELLYKERKDLDIKIYGHGMAAWLWRHYCLYKKYQAQYNDRLNEAREGSCSLDDFIATISSGVKLSKAE